MLSALTGACRNFAVNLHTKPRNMSRPCICLFLNLFVCLALKTSAQQGFDSTMQFKSNGLYNRNVATGLTYLKPLPTSLFNSLGSTSSAPLLRTLPSNFYASNLGFFCSKEIQIEKVTKIPFRFRLGSVQYTDNMEGKNRRR
jgi:hypothetical protein